jgi:hypothetical protein
MAEQISRSNSRRKLDLITLGRAGVDLYGEQAARPIPRSAHHGSASTPPSSPASGRIISAAS